MSMAAATPTPRGDRDRIPAIDWVTGRRMEIKDQRRFFLCRVLREVLGERNISCDIRIWSWR
jgi:hypothetical protein